MQPSDPIAIVDLFSGPGGLGEGFSAVRDSKGNPRYQIDVSIEKEASAHRTLRLRAFLRQFDRFPDVYYAWMAGDIEEPDWSGLWPEAWAVAEHEALCLELGKPTTSKLLKKRLRAIRKAHGGRTILIGGPPCQAYSLVGRARNAGKADYRPEFDHRNFLYDEYVNVLAALSPAAFVMENVKGMLSAAVSGSPIFEQVMDDLRSAGAVRQYELFALSSDTPRLPGAGPNPQDFIVRAEEHGVPQARHRVIILGLRKDIVQKLPVNMIPALKKQIDPVTVSMILSEMPSIRSGLSRGDGADQWTSAMDGAFKSVTASLADIPAQKARAIRREMRESKAQVTTAAKNGRSSLGGVQLSNRCPVDLANWIHDDRLTTLAQNTTRGHMPSDLARYLFAACYGRAFGVSPKSGDFPDALAPNHKNWKSGKFNDRFRVQLEERPASTVTSHIAKDGHYFIHPDPSQCRSLTVREAARLQTFPDNYAFLGNRTEQYVQVGNAVPPYLAWLIAVAVLPVFDHLDSLTKKRATPVVTGT